MNEQERYLFDLQGFLAIANILSPEHLQQLNQILDHQIAAHQPSPTSPPPNSLRFANLLSWGSAYRALINHPRLIPYLSVILGPNVRLDHDYAHIIYQGLGPIGATLHGGGTPHDPSQFYQVREGQIQSGLVAVAYNLTDVHPGEGGFACIPGSHKSNFPLPPEWRDLQQPCPWVQAVPAPAGSVILFSEALTHGTLPWRGSHPRRTLFFKFSPQHLAWMRRYYNPEDYPDLTKEQRSRLSPPGIWP